MKNLIDALTIFLKYGNPNYPTCCEHDVLIICGIDPSLVSEEDKRELNDLGFRISEEYAGNFISYKYGSA